MKTLFTKQIRLSLTCAIALSMGLVSCSDDNDLLNTTAEGLLDMSHYATVFSNTGHTSDNVQQAAVPFAFDDDEAVGNGSKKIYPTYDMNWWWSYGDRIWAFKNGSFVPSEGNNIPANVEKVEFAQFGFNESFSAQTVKVRYTGNEGEGVDQNGGRCDRVTIAAIQEQDAEGSSSHVGRYGDCGVADAVREGDTYGFEIHHSAAYLLLTPRMEIEGGIPSFYTASDGNTYTGRQIAIKSITLTKLNTDEGNGMLCGTYDFDDGGLVLSSVQDGGTQVKLVCPMVDGKWSSIGDLKDVNKTFYVVVQPGHHKLRIDYELDMPEMQFTYNPSTDETTYQIKTGSQTFSRVVEGDFTENGFSKITHRLFIPSYRESYNYYTWGAYSNILNSDGQYIMGGNNRVSYPFDLTGVSQSIFLPNRGYSLVTMHAGDPPSSADPGAWVLVSHQFAYYSNMSIETHVEEYNPMKFENHISMYAKYPIYSEGSYEYANGVSCLLDSENMVYQFYYLTSPTTNTFSLSNWQTYDQKQDEYSANVYDKTSVEPQFLSPARAKSGQFSLRKVKLASTKIAYNIERSGQIVHTNTSYAETLPVVVDNSKDLYKQYRSITRMPSANEMTYYLRYGDIHFDYQTPWMARDKALSSSDSNYPLIRGGIWIKKKAVIAAAGHTFSTTTSAYGNDFRAAVPTSDNSFRVYRENYTGSLPSGAVKAAKIGVPENIDDYFFIPLLGYYYNSSLNPNGPTIRLRHYGTHGYYWTRTMLPENYNGIIAGHATKSYYLKITPDYVGLCWDGEDNRVQALTGNERPDWQRYMPESERKIGDVMQNDIWFQ